MTKRAFVAIFRCIKSNLINCNRLHNCHVIVAPGSNSPRVVSSKRGTSLLVKNSSVLEDNQVLFEFGSPNIAKPFHPGNFRSTLLGSFLARLFIIQRQKQNTRAERDNDIFDDVIRVNYYGDWGQQFNLLLTYCLREFQEELLQVARRDEMEIAGDKRESHAHHHEGEELARKIESLDIDDLLQLYSKAFQLSESDEDFKEKCAETQTLMESGDESSLRLWQIIRHKSLLYFNRVFTMFGIEFDQQIGESQYRHKTKEVVEAMKQSLDFTEESNGTLCFKLHKDRPRKVSSRSNIISTYLTRDIAAALDRVDTFARLKQIYYVVDKSQSEHFENLFFALRNILGQRQQKNSNLEGSNHLSMVEFVHVKFGRVIGMSARRNRSVSVEKVVTECEERVMQRLQSVNTTKSDKTEFETVAHKLALAALIVNCFSYKRLTDYRFDWDRVTSLKGVSGVYMLMTYARISSLLRMATAADDVTSGALNTNHEQQQLISSSIEWNAWEETEGKGLQGTRKVPDCNPPSPDMICRGLRNLRDSVQSHETEGQVMQRANELIDHLQNYQSTLDKCVQDLDPFHLCMYVHHLCRKLSRLYKVAPCAAGHAADAVELAAETRQIRLNCFRSGLSLLHHGLLLMGITPLHKI